MIITRACPKCGGSAVRVVWPWWRELLYREKPGNVPQTVRDFQSVRCASCGTVFTDRSIRIFGLFPPRLYWIPYSALFVLILAFGVYLLSGER
jgi:hypothetical protein